jgi:hypothetical protein
MKPLDIDLAVQYVVLREDRWIFSHASRVPAALRGKPVPRAVTPDGAAVYFFSGTSYAIGRHYDPLLKAYATLPPEARDGIGSLNPEMVSEANSNINIMHKMSPSDTWSILRDRAIQQAVQRLMERTGAEQFQVLPAVAALFEVSPRVVKKAMGGLVPTSGPELDYRKDYRWRSVVGEAHRAKSSAYGRDTVRAAGTPARYGRFSVEDLLIKHRGERLFPERCPVLGLPLIYDRHSHPKDLRLISIARRDNTKPMGPDNVHLVSRRAYKLLETRSKPETQEEADAVALWRAGLPNPSINTTGR